MILQTLTYCPGTGWSCDLPSVLDAPETLLLLFADPCLLTENTHWRSDIQAAFPNSVLLGCSSLTPFVNGKIADHQAVLTICRFEKTHLKAALQSIASPEDSYHAGRTIGESLNRPDLRLILLLGDDLAINANEFMRGLNSVTSQPILISGGMASHPEFATGERILLLNQHMQNQAVVAVGIYNDDDSLIVRQAEGIGLETHSQPYEITRSEGRVIYEINHRPAADVYCEFLGDLSPLSSTITYSFPVGFFECPASPLRVVRSIFKIDEAARALIFFGDLPPERFFRFMVGLPSGLVTSARKTASRVSESVDANQPLLSLMVSCICREFALGAQVGKEPAAAFAALPPGTTQVGFYGSGEIAWSGAGYCELHNHTINVTLLGER